MHSNTGSRGSSVTGLIPLTRNQNGSGASPELLDVKFKMPFYQHDGKEIYIHRGNCPTSCSGWNGKQSELQKYDFTELLDLIDSSHEHYKLFQCNVCHSYTLWHWHEEIGWDGSGDSQSIVTRALKEADAIAIKFFHQHREYESTFDKYLHSLVMRL